MLDNWNRFAGLSPQEIQEEDLRRAVLLGWPIPIRTVEEQTHKERWQERRDRLVESARMWILEKEKR